MKELTTREMQEVSLEILHTIASICEKQHFRYALIYGTLIGAVRHKGYIPWDDDVDIMMPRPDYDRLLEYLKENIVDYSHLKVFNREECPEYPYMITRISDQRYRIEMENEKPFGLGVFIDIYPYDGLGDTKEEAVAFGMKGDRLSSFCYQATREHFAIETTTSAFRKLIKYPVYLFSKVIGKNYFQSQLDKLARVKDYDNSNFVGCVIWLSWGEKDIFPREWFDETILVPFEKYEFRIPKEFDKILRHEYGDYMILPPEKDRVGHHYFKAYKK
ncbi:LicD family protein [Streptococcus constellatus]|uniref:LICD family protein n=1 Tax=Streptococcus constellatus subsp. constellatus SK53 TaxID=1095730 RepID=A0AAD2SUV9_STRCV|nr:LicD family protein [Streptococcus constellatus]EID19083.1 LICD family protein [Streptococcus constellatus subsp. constellatus SK53]MDP1485546.1 LicD family protein [Streptococcus constellatus]QQT05057.1 LicD family protein [Streptococcus constellatus]SUN41390.1 phosphorylcholine transferase LicD1 [Streptococcus constellatus]BBD23445.1 LICD family protein [Streptococcus constellatus subsp. constellatus]